jgi:hypothetical protein
MNQKQSQEKQWAEAPASNNRQMVLKQKISQQNEKSRQKYIEQAMMRKSTPSSKIETPRMKMITSSSDNLRLVPMTIWNLFKNPKGQHQHQDDQHQHLEKDQSEDYVTKEDERSTNRYQRNCG